MISRAELWHGITHLLFPHLCEGCNKPLLHTEKVLCISCHLQLPQTDFHNIPNNETALRFAGRVPFVHATSFAHFTDGGLLQHLLHGMKYKGKKETGYYLGRQFVWALQEAAWVKDIDVIIPVPLHPKKEALRGYNQSYLIASGLSDVLGIQTLANGLVRTRNTESQVNKSRTERQTNMQEAFRVADAGLIHGKHVLLVDDVLTTGATLEACANALLAIKDVRVSIGTVGLAAS